MAIDLNAINMNELKKAVSGLNKAGLVPKMAVTGKKAELAQRFVDGLAACDKVGKLDDVPEEVFNFYAANFPKKEEAAQTAAAPAAAKAPAKPKTATKAPAKPKAATAPAKVKSPTRASVFAKILKRGKFTRAQLTEKLDAEYKENTKENNWWIGTYIAVLSELGAVTVDDKARVVYGG